MQFSMINTPGIREYVDQRLAKLSQRPGDFVLEQPGESFPFTAQVTRPRNHSCGLFEASGILLDAGRQINGT
jgi:hypothetical protein